MTKRESLTRTCTACGMEKPLSAFLQISGSQGTRYGNICSACRGTGIKEKSAVPTLEDEQGSASSSIRIGIKQKLEIEKEKQRKYQNLKQQQRDEEKKRGQIVIEKNVVTEQKEKTETKHRHVIEAKKTGFLNYQAHKASLHTQPFAGLKKEERAPLDGLSTEERQQVVELKKIEDTLQEELKNTTLDLTGMPILDQQHAVISRENPIFKQFQAWLGSDAPIMKTMAQFYKQPAAQAKHAADKTPQKESALQPNEARITPPSRKR